MLDVYARMKAILEQDFIVNEILGFVVKTLATDVCFGKRDIFHHGYAIPWDSLVTEGQKSLSTSI